MTLWRLGIREFPSPLVFRDFATAREGMNFALDFAVSRYRWVCCGHTVQYMVAVTVLALCRNICRFSGRFPWGPLYPMDPWYKGVSGVSPHCFYVPMGYFVLFFDPRTRTETSIYGWDCVAGLTDWTAFR